MLPWGVLALALAAAQPSPEALDALYARRDQPGVAAELEELAASTGDEAGYAVLWRLARHRCWLADASHGPEAVRQAQAGLAQADQAATLQPSHGEAAYWGAIAVGIIARESGMLQAFASGAEGAFRSRLEAALHSAPGIAHGGPALVEGRYYQEAPWPRRDRDRARQAYESVLRRCPENLRARLYLAELDAECGDAQASRAALEAILAADIAYDPPEGRLIQRLAQKRLAQLQR